VTGTRPGVYLLAATGPTSDSVRAILGRDLDYSDRLNVIMPEGVAVVQASVTPSGSLHVAVHDVAGARVLNVIDLVLPSPALGADWRLAVHGASDEIEKSVTGERGIAQTRILYEREQGVWIVDSDGANAHPVSNTHFGMSPAWHPGGRFLAYTELPNSGHQSIVVRDQWGQDPDRRFTARGTVNITPAFSPDGSSLVFASGDDGTDLYAVDPFGTEKPHRLTIGHETTTAGPTFSPDSRRIAFTSSRLGHPEVYITDADGTNPVLLTSSGIGEQSYRSDPDWSPDGRKVAFQSQVNGRFQVMTINVRDQSVQALTSEGRNETPSWAPDSRHLVFTSDRSGVQQLFVLDTESSKTRQLTHGTRSRLPAWSPHLDAAK
jgi:TolB protein